MSEAVQLKDQKHKFRNARLTSNKKTAKAILACCTALAHFITLLEHDHLKCMLYEGKPLFTGENTGSIQTDGHDHSSSAPRCIATSASFDVGVGVAEGTPQQQLTQWQPQGVKVNRYKPEQDLDCNPCCE